MNKGIFITVRTGSSRLPNKALLKIKNKTTIEHLISRVKKSNLADKIILCTTYLPEDNILCEIARNNEILYHRGSVEDKLMRWNEACEKYSIDFFVTADGDDLFCEPELIDLAFKQYNNSDIDFIMSDEIICGTFTYGIKSSALRKVCEIKNTSNTEMMWPYFTDTGLFKVESLQEIPKEFKRKDIRMTLDYEDDFIFFKKIIEFFEKENKKYFSLHDIITHIDKNPKIKEINFHLEERWKENQIKKTNLILKKNA